MFKNSLKFSTLYVHSGYMFFRVMRVILHFFTKKNQTRAKIFVKLICFLFLGAEIQRKESLCPPPKRGCTWDEYIQSPAGQHPVLGRTPKCKESSRAFKATVAMSEDFPLTVDMLLNVLEVCMWHVLFSDARCKHFLNYFLHWSFDEKSLQICGLFLRLKQVKNMLINFSGHSA